MDRERTRIAEDYHHDLQMLRSFLAAANASDLKRRSHGTRWTNEQLLFHMVFGYMVVRALLPLVHVLVRCPPSARSTFCRLLNAGSALFHPVNYLGSCAAAAVYNHRRMAFKLQRTIAALEARLEAETTASLQRRTDFPDRWDPFFTPAMSVEQIYAYPSRHFAFHARQLALPAQ